MRTAWLDRPLGYDGSQLRPHWIRREAGLVGDAIVGFRGPCRVADREMVDLVDALAGESIAGDDMVHFVGEVFDDGELVRAVLRQRLFAATALEVLLELGADRALRREGDDLWLGRGKLSISVATRSLVSTLFHFAVNATNAGTPVETAALKDLGVEPAAFAARLLERAADEDRSLHEARTQLRPRGDAD